MSNRKYMELKAVIASPLDGQLASLSTAAEEDTETRDRCNRPKSHSGQKKTMPEPIVKQEQQEEEFQREGNAYVRPDRGNRPTDQRVRGRTAYARPDHGKGPKHHSGGHNKKQCVVKQEEEEGGNGEEEEETLTLRQEQKFNSKEGGEAEAEEGDEEQQEYNSKEEAKSRKAPRTCNKPFGCGKVFCDQCYLPRDALGHRR